MNTYLTNLVIVNQLSKVFLYGVFLIILLVEVGCRSVNNTSVALKTSNSAAFKLRYNALYNVDKVLKEAEEGMVREEIIWLPNSLFGVPDFKYEKDVEAAILKLLELLPQATDSDFKNSLYFKLGKAYYLKADYYTSLEYFALSENNLLTSDIIFWKSRVLSHIGKEQIALQLLEKLSADSLSKKDKSIYAAHKAEIFFQLDNLDSAIFYLEKALANNVPKKYKKYWQLKLGERLSIKNPDKAVGYLHQLARSNTAPSELKLQAEIELISLQQFERSQQIVKLEALNKKGYTIGKERQLDFALANLYTEYLMSDSASHYFEKVLEQDDTPSLLISKSHFELAKLFVKDKMYDLAQNQFESIQPNYLIYFERKDQKIITNSTELLNLLKSEATDKMMSHAKYDLAKFYINLGLQDEALSIIEKLDIKDTAFDYLHLSALLDTSKVDILNNKYSELITQRQQFFTVYSNLYAQYQLDSFQNVIVGVENLVNDSSLFPQDRSRLAYLKAFAIGHIFPVDSLLRSFTEILTRYNQDRAIVKSVHSHIDFIERNKSMFANRQIALEKAILLVADLGAIDNDKTTLEFVTDSSINKTGTFIDYKLPELEPYYFVVLVDDLKINLSATRYGIGQFIRTRFPRQGYGHNLSELDNSHQMIKVGVFENLETAKEFESKILNLLPQIIKIDEKKYSTFVVPKSVLDMSEEMSFINDYLKKYIEN
ncbi:tetratricopeptide repeat protein [Sphingobacterium cavernae]|uniref:tetratricopeptide repeat protein n=1 Tax=Sphingobacterium cavernae TaxID=2592657 RepID=UPI0012300EA2|nr:hypothetical protein [Sphingobacterium cavernae]